MQRQFWTKRVQARIRFKAKQVSVSAETASQAESSVSAETASQAESSVSAKKSVSVGHL